MVIDVSSGVNTNFTIYLGWGGECREHQRTAGLGTSNVTEVILNVQPM